MSKLTLIQLYMQDVKFYLLYVLFNLMIIIYKMDKRAQADLP